MSQRRKTRRNFSQAGGSSQMDLEDESYENIPSSQADTSLSKQEHAHHVSNVVKYILASDQMKIPIIKSKMSEAINCKGKALKSVMDSAQQTLSEIFGFEVIDLDGKIMLINKIKNDHLVYSYDVRSKYALLFLILAHIYMSGESCSEESLVRFLTKLEIVIDGNMRHDKFGNLTELIFTDFVKQRYLSLEQKENQSREIKWGDRAKHELTQRSIMEFVKKAYNDRRPMSSWRQQYETMLKNEQEKKDKKKSNEKVVQMVID